MHVRRWLRKRQSRLNLVCPGDRDRGANRVPFDFKSPVRQYFAGNCGDPFWPMAKQQKNHDKNEDRRGLNADIMERPDYLVEVHLWPVIQSAY